MDEPKILEELQEQQKSLTHRLDSLQKAVDDLLWNQWVGDVACVDKHRITGPSPTVIPNPTAQGASNPIVFYTYTFTPKNLDPDKKHPLLVLPHGGVHSNMTSSYSHIIKELVSQGYVIVAPEYRGSTGYGKRFFELIDYGGVEAEDTFASRNWMVENFDYIDPKRVGIMGWSHGGLHALMNIFEHPDAYQCAFAGVPVSDLIARMGYKSQEYRDMYSAKYHIGKPADEDVAEYRKRSPAWNAEKLATPLLIHTNTIDEDVNVLEVEHLIKSLKAHGKDFEYTIFDAIPGGHVFDRIQTKKAKEIRLSVYKFLARYLKPENPL
ncbi:prolyl oligopeptidase family serine peptidase [Candidatus Bathyarchaeota archaeon]|jgi:dipeptidyl aminopeptidase/acylaminoacyl peptidase|nr:S9 family peptidase [Candidatus Bathyarchaeota archaeon]MCJ7731352.1 prolyl oligopeptidase family serine peptidase [Candidatus Bathyarchaeota archaeon]TFH18536.1 MAG: S9 family peptidase [Candidatus Bathyarchaeota archaeon]